MRDIAAANNKEALGEDMQTIIETKESKDEEEEYVLAGNQKALFEKMLANMAEGDNIRDIENVEERNNTWFANKRITPGEKQLWVVGCKHLAGLITLFGREGWKISRIESLEQQ